MKYLTLIRHAKSSWENPSLKDINRPLNSRGERDAPVIGTELKSLGEKFDYMISSPALRAISTCSIIAGKTGYPHGEIYQTQEIYHADAGTLLKITKGIPDQYSNVALFGHNPGFTYFLNKLCNLEIENLPTCGVASIHFELKKWEDVEYGLGKLERFITPKSLHKNK